MHKTPEIARLIHENFWIVLSFALAQPAAKKLMGDRFYGEWQYLHQTIDEYAERRADRALLELGVQLRVLDDAYQLNADYLSQTPQTPFGTVTQKDGSTTDLRFRDMTNKIVHAASFEWALGADDPFVICHPHDRDRWLRADVRLQALMAFVGQLML
jgi:hypothetical protein